MISQNLNDMEKIESNYRPRSCQGGAILAKGCHLFRKALSGASIDNEPGNLREPVRGPWE
jgi:hypothetical protein